MLKHLQQDNNKQKKPFSDSNMATVKHTNANPRSKPTSQRRQNKYVK